MGVDQWVDIPSLIPPDDVVTFTIWLERARSAAAPSLVGGREKDTVIDHDRASRIQRIRERELETSI